MGGSWPLLLSFNQFTVNYLSMKNCQGLDSNLLTYGVGSDHAANCSTINA